MSRALWLHTSHAPYAPRLVQRLATMSLSCRYSGRPKDTNATFHCKATAQYIRNELLALDIQGERKHTDNAPSQTHHPLLLACA